MNKPGNYELVMGTPLKDLIYKYAGGIKDGKNLKAVIPGGASTPVLKPEHIDVKMDYESVGAVGSMLGSGAVVVMDESVCMVGVARRLLKFLPMSLAANALHAVRGRTGLSRYWTGSRLMKAA